MILYTENPKDTISKSLELIREFSKVTGYKINTEKSRAFLYTNTEISEREIKEWIPFTIATKKTKCLGTNLPKEIKEPYRAKDRAPMKEIKGNTRRHPRSRVEESMLWKWLFAFAKSLQSCPTLCDPIDGSPPGSPAPGILQGRTLEWVAISFSNAWKWKVKLKSLSRVQPSATPWTTAFQGPPSMGFSRQEYWSGVPLPSPENDYTTKYNPQVHFNSYSITNDIFHKTRTTTKPQ